MKIPSPRKHPGSQEESEGSKLDNKLGESSDDDDEIPRQTNHQVYIHIKFSLILNKINLTMSFFLKFRVATLAVKIR